MACTGLAEHGLRLPLMSITVLLVCTNASFTNFDTSTTYQRKLDCFWWVWIAVCTAAVRTTVYARDARRDALRDAWLKCVTTSHERIPYLRYGVTPRETMHG
jgi:hypothetical protein